VDFDSLSAAGSMMGSGGMIVMDERTCMVDVARYFIDFLEGESCGKCVPCREGLRQLGIMLKQITEGQGDEALLGRIEALARTMISSSLCALGKSAPNPVLSTLTHFRDEYRAHFEGRCPAGVCKALVTYSINDACTGCVACVKVCPVDAISGEKKQIHVIDAEVCTRCGACVAVCNFAAIDVA
jgi:ferredoxin